MPDSRFLTDWTVAWARLRPWGRRIVIAISSAAALALGTTGLWLSFRYPAGPEPDVEHYRAPLAGEVPGAQWIHDLHRWSGAVLVSALALGVAVVAFERLRVSRRLPAVRSVGVALVVVMLLIAGERTGRHLRWVDYVMGGTDIARDDGEGFVRDEVPHDGIWSIVSDDRVERVETLGGGHPVSTSEVSATTYRRRVLTHLVVVPAALLLALWLFRGRRIVRRAPTRERERPVGGPDRAMRRERVLLASAVVLAAVGAGAVVTREEHRVPRAPARCAGAPHANLEDERREQWRATADRLDEDPTTSIWVGFGRVLSPEEVGEQLGSVRVRGVALAWDAGAGGYVRSITEVSPTQADDPSFRTQAVSLLEAALGLNSAPIDPAVRAEPPIVGVLLISDAADTIRENPCLIYSLLPRDSGQMPLVPAAIGG